MSASVKIKHCSCRHDFQDATYGEGMRVHNKAGGNKKPLAWRCTVCGKETVMENQEKKAEVPTEPAK